MCVIVPPDLHCDVPVTLQTRKVIQLYETQLVRHGLMCVGPTGGGKTTVSEILKDALVSLHRDGHKHHYYQPVHTYTLNPKVATPAGSLWDHVLWDCTIVTFYDDWMIKVSEVHHFPQQTFV